MERWYGKINNDWHHDFLQFQLFSLKTHWPLETMRVTIWNTGQILKCWFCFEIMSLSIHERRTKPLSSFLLQSVQTFHSSWARYLIVLSLYSGSPVIKFGKLVSHIRTLCLASVEKLFSTPKCAYLCMHITYWWGFPWLLIPEGLRN